MRVLTLNLFQGIQDSLVHDPEGSRLHNPKGLHYRKKGQPVMRQAMIGLLKK